MSIVSILLFLAYLWGFGFGTLKALRLKEAESAIERNVMRLGIGAASLVITAILLDILNVPLDWKIFLLIATAGPAYHIAKHRKPPAVLKPKLRKSELTAFGMILIFLGSIYMYASGAFSYPYLENDDPWSHASGIKYVATEKTVDAPQHRGFQYMNPYPPAYDLILALMHQTTPSLYWTMKFFNALIVSLSIPFFYYFAKIFTGNRNKALFATAVLASVPAYQSHFIWAPALAMMLFPAAMYAMEMIKQDKRWKFAAAIAIGGLLVSHPTHSVTLSAMIAIYAFVKMAKNRSFKTYATAGIGGVLLSLTWWGLKGKSFFRENIKPHHGFGETVAESTGIITKLQSAILSTFPKFSGTASRPYTFSDFFVAKGQNLINNPVGIGVVAGVLFVIGLIATPIMGIRKLSIEKRLGLTAITTVIFVFFVIARQESVFMLIAVYTALMILIMAISSEWKRKTYFFITLAWFLLTFLIVNNQTFNLPIGFYAFRTWMIMAVPLAIIAAEGLWNVFALMNITGMDKKTLQLAKIGLVAAVVAGLWMTSGQQKYEVNTAGWPPGAFWTSIDEVAAYVWLQNLPEDTKVFSYLTDDQVVGMDKFSCGWCKSEAAYRQNGFGDTPRETSEWMKANGYEYVIIGGREIREFGQEETIGKIQDMASSELFIVAHQTQGALVLRVV